MNDHPAIEDHITLIPRTKPLIRNAKDGTWLRLIPTGEFLAGDEKFPVRLPGYYMGLTCVTNAQYARFLSESRPAKSDLDKWVWLDKNCFVRQSVDGYEAYGDKDEHPVVQVSWYGADAYCQWSGLRLPSELEWEKGARGVDGRVFPWGGTWDEHKCRYDKNSFNETTCRVWGYPEGNSPFGLYQMSGNVWEWCEDWYDGKVYDRYRSGDLSQPGSDASRVLRGGAWFSLDAGGFRCAYRNNYEPDLCSSNFGFRCARTL